MPAPLVVHRLNGMAVLDPWKSMMSIARALCLGQDLHVALDHLLWGLRRSPHHLAGPTYAQGALAIVGVGVQAIAAMITAATVTEVVAQVEVVVATVYLGSDFCQAGEAGQSMMLVVRPTVVRQAKFQIQNA